MTQRRKMHTAKALSLLSAKGGNKERPERSAPTITLHDLDEHRKMPEKLTSGISFSVAVVNVILSQIEKRCFWAHLTCI